MEEHFLGNVCQKAIIEKEGKVLLVRDINDADIWELPGGRLNVHEIPEEGLKREIKEELGVEIDIHDLVYTEQSLHTQKGNQSFFLIYRATLTNPEHSLALNMTEIVEVKWIERSELGDQKIYPTYLKGLEAYFAKST